MKTGSGAGQEDEQPALQASALGDLHVVGDHQSNLRMSGRQTRAVSHM